MRGGLLVSEVDAKADRWGFVIEEVILSQGAAVAETMEVLPCKVLLRTLPLVNHRCGFVALSGCTGCRCHDHRLGPCEVRLHRLPLPRPLTWFRARFVCTGCRCRDH